MTGRHGEYDYGRFRRFEHFNRFELCYRAMAIWYIMQKFPEILDTRCRQTLTDQIRKVEILDDAPSRRDGDSDLKFVLLVWYFGSCISGISDQLNLPIKGESSVQAQARKAMKLSKKTRDSATDSYSADYELVDRLGLLAAEMFPESANPGMLNAAKVCSDQAQHRILQRSKTIIFNAGTTKSKTTRNPSPWELGCLSHHNLLRTGLYQSEDFDIKAAKDACFEFLSSDYSFLPTWDSSRWKTFYQWWDVDVSSIVCATLLDLKIKCAWFPSSGSPFKLQDFFLIA